MMVYVKEYKKYFQTPKVPKKCKGMILSESELITKLLVGDSIPEWFSPSSVIKILKDTLFKKEIFDINEDSEPHDLVSQNPYNVIEDALKL